MGLRLATVVAAAALLPLTIGGAAAHGPDPMLSGGLFGQNQDLRFRWRAGSVPTAVIKTAIKAAAAQTPTRPAPRRRRRSTYDAGGANPIGYGRGRDLRRQRPGLLHPRAPRPASRCGCASRATSSTGARSSGARRTPARPTAATTPRRSRSTSSATSRASTTTSTTPTTRTTSTPSSRPTRGRSRPPAGTCTSFGRCDVATLQLQYDMQTCEPRSTRPASTSPPS